MNFKEYIEIEIGRVTNLVKLYDSLDMMRYLYDLLTTKDNLWPEQ